MLNKQTLPQAGAQQLFAITLEPASGTSTGRLPFVGTTAQTLWARINIA